MLNTIRAFQSSNKVSDASIFKKLFKSQTHMKHKDSDTIELSNLVNTFIL